MIYATDDLDAAAVRVEAALGVAAVPGGRHARIGTENRIVPLGGGYLELLAVADAAEAASSPFGKGLLRRLGQGGDGLFGWAVSVDDLGPVTARLGTPVVTITREGMSARLTGVVEAMAEPCLPFFISRAPDIPDPGAIGDAGGIAWVEVAGDRARLERWLGGAELPVRVVDGRTGVRALGVGGRELRTS